MARRKKAIPTSIRLAVIARDNGRCRACGIGDVDALQCDHITPESKGGTDTLDNLQALCGVCNNRKGNTDVGELPSREAVSGFGDYNEVMRERTAFLELVSDTRQRELDRVKSLIQEWREANVRALTIKNRVKKLVNANQVEKLLRE